MGRAALGCPRGCPVCRTTLEVEGWHASTVVTLEGPIGLSVASWGCPNGHPEGRWTSPFRSTLAAPYHVLGLDVMIAVGLLRFGLDLSETKCLAFLKDGCGLELPQSSLSRLSTEFLVRWRMFCETELPKHRNELGPWVVQLDSTMTPGAPATCRVRHALTGVTVWAEQLESERKDEVVRFLRTFRAIYGISVLWIRDQSSTLREALNEVYPGVPQQEDHWHFLSDLGAVVLPDYEEVRRGLVAGEALARLTEWSRTLPLIGTTLEAFEAIWVRLALEWVEDGRRHPGGFPFRLAYLEVARRLERVLAWSKEILRGNLHWNTSSPEVTELKARLERLLEREIVRVPLGRLRAEVVLWEEIRSAMRAERSRRSREDLAPMTHADVVEAQGRIAAAEDRFVRLGTWAERVGGKVIARFETHAPYLWVEVPALSVVVRSTVALERDHGADRRRIRQRRGQEATGEEMGQIGALLAFWSNARCRWFVEQVLPHVHLWDVFAHQDPEEVRRRLRRLPREGRRPRVEVGRGKAGERLEAFVKLLQGEGSMDPHLTAWAVSVGALPEEVSIG